MKVEQLKAELVVFKGLMSNVSATNPTCPTPSTLPLRRRAALSRKLGLCPLHSAAPFRSTPFCFLFPLYCCLM